MASSASRGAPDDFVVFRGRLSELAAKVDSGEFTPKLQASHAPPCKFWTAFSVINGIRHTVPLIHGPTGCTYSVASDFKLSACEYRGTPVEPTPCTALDETNVVYGGEAKLTEAITEVVRKYGPELVVVLSCCCSGITGDDVEMVAREASKRHGLPVLAIRSEGFGGDFRSGHEDAFRALMDLMEPPTAASRRGMERTVNIIGARIGPTYTERRQDIDVLTGLMGQLGIAINGVICGGCTVAELRRAPSAALNTSWCYDWGGKIGELMEKRFGVPFARTGLPYGLAATRHWIRTVCGPLGLTERGEEFIAEEERKVGAEAGRLRELLDGRTALIEIADFPGPIRALAMARMAGEFGARPLVINLHPYTVKERRPTIEFLLGEGHNPEVILTEGLFSLGTFEASRDTEAEIEAIAAGAAAAGGRPIYFGVPSRMPGSGSAGVFSRGGCPVVNLTSEVGTPQYGYVGLKNIAHMVEEAVKHATRPRSRLFREVLYGRALPP